MTRIIAAPQPGVVDVRGMGVGFPGLHNQTRAAGNGLSPSITREIYYAAGITNNTAANSSNILDWLREEGTVFTWWADIAAFVFSFYNRLWRLNGNQSSACPAMIGGLAGWNVGLPFDQWLTDQARKRAGLIATRDGAGNINYYLSWANAVTRNQINILAPPAGSWVSLIYTANPRQLAMYVDGNLWASTQDSALPTGAFTDNILFSLGAAKKLIDATETSVRVFAPLMMPARSVSGL